MDEVRSSRDYIENHLYIKTKDAKLTLLKFNKAQQKLYQIITREHGAGRPIRIIILKARQLGFSTLTEAVLFHRSVTRENTNGLIIAHTEEATTNLFNMSKLFYEELPEDMKPMRKASNAKELVFENPTKSATEKKSNPGLRSKLRCATAGGKAVGRSFTIKNLHASEYAFWPGNKRETLAGLMQALPALPDSMVLIESTANGFDDFKQMWDAAVSGESDFVPVFFPWFENEDYKMAVPDGTVWTEEERTLKQRFKLSDEQLQWRRWCIKSNCGGICGIFIRSIRRHRMRRLSSLVLGCLKMTFSPRGGTTCVGCLATEGNLNIPRFMMTVGRKSA